MSVNNITIATPLTRFFSIFLLVILSGCSAASLVYNNADDLIGDRIGEAFDLTYEQKTELEPLMTKFLTWHREQELPRYIIFLDEVLSHADGDIDAADILWVREEVRKARERAMHKMITYLAELSLTLTPAQIEHFVESRTEQRRDDNAYLALSDEKRTKKRVHRQFERMEGWFEDLSREKRDALKRSLATLPDNRSAWFRYEARRDKALLDILASDTNIEERRQSLIDLLVNRKAPGGMEFVRFNDQFWREFAVIIAEVSNGLTEDQQEDLREKIRDYRQTVIDIQS